MLEVGLDGVSVLVADVDLVVVQVLYVRCLLASWSLSYSPEPSAEMEFIVVV